MSETRECTHEHVSWSGSCWRCGAQVYRYIRSAQAWPLPPHVEGSNDRETWTVIRDGGLPRPTP